jgi:ATP-dependent helicase HrpB
MNARGRDLPIHAIERELAEALRRHARLVLEAPTGSGKSTQVPQMILDHGLAGRGRIVVLQPRRLAARMLARWVAQERGVALGDEVGYQVRLEKRASESTRILYETEGVLLRQLLSDPELAGVSVIVFDEFHERHVHADVMLPLALRLQRERRPDLKIVVMSATLDGARLEGYLAPAVRLRTEGRMFPVEIRHAERDLPAERFPIWQQAADALARAWSSGGDEGHALIFMPGAYEIQRTLDALRQTLGSREAELLALHGELSPELQDAAVTPSARRKVVVATNIAETSLTIDGVTLVIDSGLARKSAYDPARGINTLLIDKISRASADQRAGRAGRTRAGRCVRLWSTADHAARVEHDAPEIQRIDLAEVLLALTALRVGDISAFPWLDAPREESMTRARLLLHDLGATDANGALTDLGGVLLRFPMHPRHARMLVAGAEEGCLREAAAVAALCQERDILMGRQNRDVRERRERAWAETEHSDLLASWRALDFAREHQYDVEACRDLGIHAVTARRVSALAGQFAGVARATGLVDRPVGDDVPLATSLRRAILAGFSDQLGRRVNAQHRRYALVHDRRGTLDRESGVGHAEFIVASEIHEIGRARGDVEVRLTQATAIECAWLRELFPGDWSERRETSLDREMKRVVLKRQTYFRDLLMEEKTGGDPSPDEAARVLAAEIAKGELTLKQWDHKVEQWVVRLNLVATLCPELGLAPITAEARRDLVEQLCLGAFSYREIKEKPVWNVVRDWLSAGQHELVERYAPPRITLSNGRGANVTYGEGKAPYIALRVQDLYDVTKPITVAMGRVRVVVQILAPNQRPVQITDDLGSFWANTYAQVKKDLRGRYPKHEWR